MGSLSFMVNHKVTGYTDIADFPETQPDAAVRDAKAEPESTPGRAKDFYGGEWYTPRTHAAGLALNNAPPPPCVLSCLSRGFRNRRLRQ